MGCPVGPPDCSTTPRECMTMGIPTWAGMEPVQTCLGPCTEQCTQTMCTTDIPLETIVRRPVFSTCCNCAFVLDLWNPRLLTVSTYSLCMSLSLLAHDIGVLRQDLPPKRTKFNCANNAPTVIFFFTCFRVCDWQRAVQRQAQRGMHVWVSRGDTKRGAARA